MDGPERLEREILIDAPQEVRVVRDHRAPDLSGWFGDSADIDLRPGGEMLLCGQHGRPRPRTRGARRAAPRLLVRWIRDEEGNSTLVEFHPSVRRARRTRLKVVESGFQELAWPEERKQKDVDDGHREGWEKELGELEDYVAVRSPAGRPDERSRPRAGRALGGCGGSHASPVLDVILAHGEASATTVAGELPCHPPGGRQAARRARSRGLVEGRRRGARALGGSGPSG